MAKKPRPNRPDGPPPLNNRDHLERANYALQASLLLRQLGVNRAYGDGDEISSSTRAKTSTIQQPAQSSSVAGPSGQQIESTGADARDRMAPSDKAARRTTRQRKRTSRGGKEALGSLSRAEVTSMRKWTVHNQVKLDPIVKRSLCSCGTVLVPGLTSRVRVKSSKQHKRRLVTSCLECGQSSSIPMAKSIWSNKERPPPFQPAAEETAQHQKEDAAAPRKIEGHVIWAGGERILGWGEPSEPSASAPAPAPAAAE